uniref:Death domain-containing protein n=1 Tax=Amphimedon queenslandica TaxID=400682 RepID=A0A1X7V950_AMPQE
MKEERILFVFIYILLIYFSHPNRKKGTILNYLPRHIWHDLGLQLGLYQPTLEDNNEDNNGDSKKYFRQCMSAWLRGKDKVREKGGPSWSSLATALDKEGKHHIATNIRDK